MEYITIIRMVLGTRVSGIITFKMVMELKSGPMVQRTRAPLSTELKKAMVSSSGRTETSTKVSLETTTFKAREPTLGPMAAFTEVLGSITKCMVKVNSPGPTAGSM